MIEARQDTESTGSRTFVVRTTGKRETIRADRFDLSDLGVTFITGVCEPCAFFPHPVIVTERGATTEPHTDSREAAR